MEVNRVRVFRQAGEKDSSSTIRHPRIFASLMELRAGNPSNHVFVEASDHVHAVLREITLSILIRRKAEHQTICYLETHKIKK